MWSSVALGGLVYELLGAFDCFGGFFKHPNVCVFFMCLKLSVAFALIGLFFTGNPGEYTLVFGVGELMWAFGFYSYLGSKEGPWGGGGKASKGVGGKKKRK